MVEMTTNALRGLLNQPGLIVAPGAYDALSARLIEMAGFAAVYMTGYGVSAGLLAQPDIGLLTMTEMANQAGNIVAAVRIPVIADGDNGYGGVLNVVRTVETYERAGVAAIQLEDQVSPKRCGHMEGKQIVAPEEMIAKVKAAVQARTSPNFIIVARTDARAANGFDDALARASAYAEAGADVIFFEAPQTVEEMKRIAASIDKPLIANMVENGKTPFISCSELQTIGYKIVIYPVSIVYTVAKSVAAMLHKLKAEGTTANCLNDMIGFQDFNELMGLRKRRALEEMLSAGPDFLAKILGHIPR